MFRIKLNNNLHLEEKTKVIATIGNFDGVHEGHKKLLRELDNKAKGLNAWRIVITFDILPREYFADKTNTLRLPRVGLLRDKIKVLKETNLVDEVVILHFNGHLAKLSPLEFIDKVLKHKLNVSHMLVGHDFRFGNKASGNINDLIIAGIDCEEFSEMRYDNVRISSSLIRELASEQNLPVIKKYLGHNISYTSRVVYGNQIGRKYGVPTINLELRKIRPVLWGIYVGFVYIDGHRYNGVVSIGKNPTVGEGKKYKVEAHLLDVDLNLYGKIASVEILYYLRPELKFTDLDTLFNQIHQDMRDARNFFAQIQE